MWKILKKEGSILHARWPQAGKIDSLILAQDEYLENALYDFRNKISLYNKSKAKSSTIQVSDRKEFKLADILFQVVEATIHISTVFPEWHLKAIAGLQEMYNKVFYVAEQRI